MKETLTLCMCGGPTAPARARRALRSLDRTLADLREDVDLLVSELVSNAVLHANADRIEFQAASGPESVWIEVSDPGPGFRPSEARREPSVTGEGGYGLNIVDMVANRWGATTHGEGRVWFEIDRESRREARDRADRATAKREGDRRFPELAAG
jgi:anti-sigma regulatory factor (Ser/Thr protein kinase)